MVVGLLFLYVIMKSFTSLEKIVSLRGLYLSRFEFGFDSSSVTLRNIKPSGVASFSDRSSFFLLFFRFDLVIGLMKLEI